MATFSGDEAIDAVRGLLKMPGGPESWDTSRRTQLAKEFPVKYPPAALPAVLTHAYSLWWKEIPAEHASVTLAYRGRQFFLCVTVQGVLHELMLDGENEPLLESPKLK